MCPTKMALSSGAGPRHGCSTHQPQQRLRQLRRARKPRKLWFSLPCTKWCRWTSLNYSTPEGKEKLEKGRRRERKMLRFARDFILESVDEIHDIDIYWEWPHPCYGWEQRPLQDLSAELGGRDIKWLHCRIDGCAYGMKGRGISCAHRFGSVAHTKPPEFWLSYAHRFGSVAHTEL